MALEVLTLIGALAILAAVALYTLSTGVPPTPTSATVRDTILTVLPADPEGVVYDAGSGFGTFAAALARRYPRHRVVGIEVSPLPWLIARLHNYIAGHINLTFRRADLRSVGFDDAGLVLCYLSGPAVIALKEKLEAAAPPECVVVSNTFAVPGWTAERVVTAPDLYATKVYVYRMATAPAG